MNDEKQISVCLGLFFDGGARQSRVKHGKGNIWRRLKVLLEKNAVF